MAIFYIKYDNRKVYFAIIMENNKYKVIFHDFVLPGIYFYDQVNNTIYKKNNHTINFKVHETRIYDKDDKHINSFTKMLDSQSKCKRDKVYYTNVKYSENIDNDKNTWINIFSHNILAFFDKQGNFLGLKNRKK